MQSDNSSTLRDLLNQLDLLKTFIDSPLHKTFKQEYEQAEQDALEGLTEIPLTNVTDVFVREQGIGQLTQIRLTKTWFESKHEDLEEQIEYIKKYKDEDQI